MTTVFLVQNVEGDAGGGSVKYELSTTCGESWPNNNTVDLREGTFNVSVALGDANGVNATSVNNDGVACTGTATISGVPSHCTTFASRVTKSLRDEQDSNGRVIFGFAINCTTTQPTATRVITIDSATTPGTYTVSWSTLGRCDPGAGTDGASGSVSRTVVDDDTPPDGEGDRVKWGIAINDICDYEWSATFVNVAGAICEITDEGLQVINNEIDLTLFDSCPMASGQETGEESGIELTTVWLYIIQSVNGDAEGGRAEYTITETCGPLSERSWGRPDRRTP